MSTEPLDGGPLSVADVPDVLSVEEAAAVLRISRGKAYELARRYLETNGAEGLPVKAFGRCFRVSRAGLEQMLGGELHWTREPKPTAVVEVPEARVEPGEPAPPKRVSRRRPSRNDAQLSLFDAPISDSPEQPR